MLAALSARTMEVVAPSGETWDAAGNEEAVVRTAGGLRKYSERDFKASKPEPTPKPKKKHKRFTSPAPDVDDEDTRAYKETLKNLILKARPKAKAAIAPPQSEKEPERDGLQEYQNALKALEDKAPSEPPRDSMAPPPRPEKRPERQESQATPEPPGLKGLTQESKRQNRWRLFRRSGADYDLTARELAKVTAVPKRPSPLSQVQTAESATPTSSPPSSPRLPPHPHSNNLDSDEETLRHMETLNKLPAHTRPLPRPGYPDLNLARREPPQEKIIDWSISQERRDISYLVELVGSPNIPL
jgi:hypothetical protein